LRFPEFSGEWKKHSLGEIGETIIGLTYKPSDVVDNNGIIVFRSSNIKNGMIDYSDLVRVNKHIKDKIITKENDILVCARNGSQRLIGKNAIIKQEDANNTFGAFMMVYRANDNPFILPLLSTKKYFSQVGENLGARINQITTSDFNGFEFYFPENHAERTKIAELFRLLDERIATQNKIIEDLKKLKSAISERLFKSVKGSTVLLSDLCDIVKGKQINGENLSDSGNYYVMNGGTEPSGYYDNYNVEASTISISEGGNSCGYVQFNTSPFWSGGHCYSIQNIADKVDNMYLYHYLKSNEDAIMKLRIGSGLPNIQKKDLAMFKIIVPKIEWQIKISTFLSSLERKAEIEERIQNVMQKQKLYLLQQMFI
jgi:type I restriction enzyme S subunit